MQVNTVSDLVTHAVIGQNEAKAAQISQSAEFFNVLSNTLYSNKKLAVSREVLCNAWDIHIQSGLLDKAIEITITDDELSIRDFGTGIHDDHIVGVYLTYGNSTKKLDGTQTGGFGLGSKSPWAVVDHFKVESNHEGVQSVYQMSKSSGEVAGVPSAKKMYSLPTTLSGLCVSFALTGYRERAEYEKLIRMLVYFGEMNATLNGEKLDTLAFSEAPYKMLLVKRSECQDLPEGRTRSIFVRYGNVVYPIPDHEKLAQAFNNITSDLQRLGRGDYSMGYQPNYVLVLQAKPNTISVTPSRESLSMTPKTVESLEELLINYQENFMGKMLLEMVDVAQKSIQTSWLHKSPADLLTSSNDLPLVNPGNTYHKAVSSIATPREATVAYMLNQYPIHNGFHEKDVEMRLEALYVSGFGNKGKILSLLKAYRRTNTKKGRPHRVKRNPRGESVDKTNWFQKVMVQPIIAKMLEHPTMSPKNFVIRGPNYDPRKVRNSDREVLTEASKYGAKDLERYLPFMSNFVVLAYNRTDVIDRLSYHPAIKNWFKSASECMVYICPRTTGREIEARKFFEDMGMYVIDLTKPMAHEHETVVLPTPKAVGAKPRKQGLVKLSQPDAVKPVDMFVLVKDEAERIDKPELFIQMNLRASDPYAKDIHWISPTAAAMAARLYGGKTGIVVNANQKARFASLGVKEYWKHVEERVFEVAQNSQAIKQAISMFPSKLGFGLSTDHAKFLARCVAQPSFGRALGLNVPDLTKEEKMVFAVIRTLESNRNRAYYFPQDKLKTLRAYYDTIPVDPLFKKLAEKLSTSSLMSAIDLDQYEPVFQEYEGQSAPSKLLLKKRQGFLDLLIYAIEG